MQRLAIIGGFFAFALFAGASPSMFSLAWAETVDTDGKASFYLPNRELTVQGDAAEALWSVLTVPETSDTSNPVVMLNRKIGKNVSCEERFYASTGREHQQSTYLCFMTINPNGSLAKMPANP